jgi:hypothetical protein
LSKDDGKSRKLVRDLLTFKGYEIIEAETGEEGVRLAQARRPGLVLMDVRLPGITPGPELGLCQNCVQTHQVGSPVRAENPFRKWLQSDVCAGVWVPVARLGAGPAQQEPAGENVLATDLSCIGLRWTPFLDVHDPLAPLMARVRHRPARTKRSTWASGPAGEWNPGSAQAVEAEGAAGEHLVLRLGGQWADPLAEHLRRGWKKPSECG